MCQTSDIPAIGWRLDSNLATTAFKSKPVSSHIHAAFASLVWLVEVIVQSGMSLNFSSAYYTPVATFSRLLSIEKTFQDAPLRILRFPFWSKKNTENIWTCAFKNLQKVKLVILNFHSKAQYPKLFATSVCCLSCFNLMYHMTKCLARTIDSAAKSSLKVMRSRISLPVSLA